MDFRRVGGARALQISRRLGRLDLGATTDDGAGQGHRWVAADLLRPGTPNSVEIDTHENRTSVLSLSNNFNANVVLMVVVN